MLPLEQCFDLTGQRALVTGAANGIGAAIARALSARGATIIAADRDEAGLRAILPEFGKQATCQVFRQDDLDSVERLCSETGDVDILINNAGILIRGPLLELNWADLRSVVDINFVGLAAITRLVGERMAHLRSGVIVNISSQQAFTAARHRSIYVATKSAVSQLRVRGGRLVLRSPPFMTQDNSPHRSCAEQRTSVMTGVSALRMACLRKTARSERPWRERCGHNRFRAPAAWRCGYAASGSPRWRCPARRQA